MPVYEYTCTACGHRFDRLRLMSRMDDEAPCPQCEADSRRQLSVFAVYATGPNGEMDAVAGGGGCGGCGPGGCARSISAWACG